MLVSGGFAQSNLARQVAAAGASLGIPVVLIIAAEEDEAPQGNLLLDYLLGAEVRRVRVEVMSQLPDGMRTAAEELRGAGRRPDVVTGYEPLGMAGYVN